jgi:hypothetical protein
MNGIGVGAPGFVGLAARRIGPSEPNLIQAGECAWSGLAAAHCACRETFTSTSGFDRHRRNGRCLDPKTLKHRDGAPVLVEVDKPNWSPPRGWAWNKQRPTTTWTDNGD